MRLDAAHQQTIVAALPESRGVEVGTTLALLRCDRNLRLRPELLIREQVSRAEQRHVVPARHRRR
jgi:hypothetical protein